MKMMTLKNGQQEAQITVNVIMTSLRSLEPVPLYELVMKCRDSKHKLFGDAGEKLAALSLIGSDGRIHDTIRNTVLSAVQGGGLDMTIGSPLAEEQPSET